MLMQVNRRIVVHQASSQLFALLNHNTVIPLSYHALSKTGILSGCRPYSVIKDFQEKFKQETEKNPEFKKTLEQLSEKGQQISEKGKEAAEKVSQASAAATEKLQQASSTVSERLQQVRSSVGERVKKMQEAASSTMKSAGQKFGAQQSSEQGETQKQWSRFSNLRSKIPSFKFSMPGTQTEGGRPVKLQSILSTIGKEVADAVLPREESVSSTKVRENVWTPPKDADPEAPSGITVVPKKETIWQQKFNEFRERFASHPLFRSLGGIKDTRFAKKTAELAEDVRERIETSDSPVVNRVLDAHDKFFTETEIQKAYRKLLERDLNFDMVKFLSSLKVDVPVVVKAYLEAQKDVLEQHCSAAMVERLMGIANTEIKQGRFTDSTILEIGEVELVPEGLKLLDEEPVIIVTFNCQQIHCVRDKFGNVLDGGPSNIQRVYYLWALRQEEHGAVVEDGRVLPPRWQIIDMMVRGMQHLL